MIVNAIYLGSRPVHRIYHGGKIIFERSPIDFHVIDEEGRLIIVGAIEANSLPDGLYLDCAPDWVSPVLDDGALSIYQAYETSRNGKALEVR